MVALLDDHGGELCSVMSGQQFGELFGGRLRRVAHGYKRGAVNGDDFRLLQWSDDLRPCRTPRSSNGTHPLPAQAVAAFRTLRLRREECRLILLITS